ncbi:MAG: TSUP family transporter [Ramlibacter sp.]
MAAWQVVAFLAAAAVATATQNITGFAMVLVLLGLTGLFDLVPLREAANAATVLSLVNAAVALRGHKHAVDWPTVRSTGLGTVVGVAAGVALLAWLSENAVLVLRLLLGVVVIACAAIVLLRVEPLKRRSPPRAFLVTGMLSGILGGLFSASGPPLVYQFYRQPLTLDAVRDSLLALLAITSLLRLVMVVPAGQFTWDAVVLSALASPVVVGVAWWMRRHPPAWDRQVVLRIVCALLVLTGIGLIAPAVSGLVGS